MWCGKEVAYGWCGGAIGGVASGCQLACVGRTRWLGIGVLVVVAVVAGALMLFHVSLSR